MLVILFILWIYLFKIVRQYKMFNGTNTQLTHINKTSILVAITYSHMEGEHDTLDKHYNFTDGKQHYYKEATIRTRLVVLV